MKTILELEPELYTAAEQLAQSQKKSVGEIVSELLRRAVGWEPAPSDAAELERRNGFDVFPERTGSKATIEAVRQLCREEGI